MPYSDLHRLTFARNNRKAPANSQEKSHVSMKSFPKIQTIPRQRKEVTEKKRTQDVIHQNKD